MNGIKIMLFLCIIGVFFSCGDNSKTKEQNISEINQETNGKEDIIEDKNEKLEEVSLKIDGMTCEIGCAKIIQSKLSKTNGIKKADVSFAEKTGVVLFDSNLITENEIVDIVHGIADGDLYEVKEVIKSE